MQKVIEVPGDPLVHLRHITYADAPALTQVIENSRNDFKEYLGWTADADISSILWRIEKLLYLSSCDEGMAYCIVRGRPEEQGKVVGLNCLFDRFPHWRMSNDKFDLKGPVAHSGIWLDKDAQHQGIARRTCRALFQYAQKQWGIESIFMDIAIDNTAAERGAHAMGALSMAMSYQQTTRPYDYSSGVEDYIAPSSSADMELMMEKAARYNERVSSNTIYMNKWLLRLEPFTPKD